MLVATLLVSIFLHSNFLGTLKECSRDLGSKRYTSCAMFSFKVPMKIYKKLFDGILVTLRLSF